MKGILCWLKNTKLAIVFTLRKTWQNWVCVYWYFIKIKL